MSPSSNDIKTEIENRLEILAEKRGKELTDKIRPILAANLDRGRIEGYISGDLGYLREYIERVADGYVNLNAYLHEIQEERTDKVWEPLFERMQTWAFYFFLRKGFKADVSTQDIAAECATEAASAVLLAHFPYDTAFDPWVHVIVQNVCRKFMRTGTKKSTIPEENLVEFNENLRTLVDPSPEEQDSLDGLMAMIPDAVLQLSESRQRVIRLIYFEELSPSEVAKKMEKSVGAIYSLQFNALEDLRKILDPNRNNLND